MPISITKEVLNEELKKTFGFSQFRGEQEAIIQNTLQGHNSFVLMPTGAGKSLCYQLPAIVMPGTAIVISPLIALMEDQVNRLKENDMPAAALVSGMRLQEQEEILAAAAVGVMHSLGKRAQTQTQSV